MANNYGTEVFTYRSFYDRKDKETERNRKLKIYFSVPQGGTNENTGLLLLIAGFGGNANSNVYKKMRNDLSDRYNLVVIQCDYFGFEFMQGIDKVCVTENEKAQLVRILDSVEVEEVCSTGKLSFKTYIEHENNYDINLQFMADLSGETIDNFNDMGIQQSVDNITAVLYVMSILYDNNYKFNTKKVILYGHSHGAYLSYLCNAFAPQLFSTLIDNSAWLYPQYLRDYRVLNSKIGKNNISVIFDYLARKIVTDHEILDLSYVYSKFYNQSNIIVYHGTTDTLISNYDKYKFCSRIDKCVYNEINKSRIDNVIFKSTDHGLDSDFIKLFDLTMTGYDYKFQVSNRFELPDEIHFETSKNKYIINYRNILPEIHIQ